MLHWVFVLFVFSFIAAFMGQEELSALAAQVTVVLAILFFVMFAIAAVFSRGERPHKPK